MRLRPIYALLLLVPLMGGLAFLPGCDDGATTKTPKKRPVGGGVDDVDVARTPYEAKSYGTITGKVVYDGTPPAPQKIKGPESNPCCTGNESEYFDQDWIVDKNGGVKNAVIILQPPPGKFFKLPAESQKPKEMVVTLSQPRCQFIPHVFTLFPNTADGAETGQQFRVINNAGCEHNTKLFVNPEINRPSSTMLKAGAEMFKPLRPQTEPIAFGCDIHGWMQAYGFVLDHPYSAVTKEDGSFVIENAPLGVPVQVVGWYESSTPRFFNGGMDGKTVTLEANQVMDFKIKKGR